MPLGLEMGARAAAAPSPAVPGQGADTPANPTMVVRKPLGVSLRTLLFHWSQMNKLPQASKAMAEGLLRDTLLPTPLAPL